MRMSDYIQYWLGIMLAIIMNAVLIEINQTKIMKQNEAIIKQNELIIKQNNVSLSGQVGEWKSIEKLVNINATALKQNEDIIEQNKKIIKQNKDTKKELVWISKVLYD